MIFKTYNGKRLDLQHYISKTISEFEFQIFDYDDNEVDLSIYSDVEIRFFEKKHGTLLYTFDTTSGIIVGSPDYSIYWTVSKEDMNLIEKPYYHECVGIMGDQEDLLFHGISEMI
jgi:hypothetical protein